MSYFVASVFMFCKYSQQFTCRRLSLQLW